MEKLELFKNNPALNNKPFLDMECSLCSRKKSRHNIILGNGRNNPELMIVLANPCKTADEYGQICGEDFDKANKIIYDIGLDNQDCNITYLNKCSSVPCSLADSKTCFINNLKKEIEMLNPKFIYVEDSTRNICDKIGIDYINHGSTYDDGIVSSRKTIAYKNPIKYYTTINEDMMSRLNDFNDSSNIIGFALNIKDDKVKGFAISRGTNIGEYFDFDSGMDDEFVINVLKNFFTNNRFSFYDGKAAIRFLLSYKKLPIHYSWDIKIAEGFHNSHLNNTNKAIVLRYLNEMNTGTDDVKSTCFHAITNREVCIKQIQQYGVEFNIPSMQMANITLGMEYMGIKVNVDKLSSLSDNYLSIKKSKEKEIKDIIGHDTNIDSNEEIKKFSDTPKFQSIIIPSLSDYHKAKKTYDSLKSISLALDDENYVHTHYGINETSTGRTTSYSPNLQNIEQDDGIRSIFIANPGYSLVEWDFQNHEIRILAHKSKDKNLIEDLNSGVDIYRRIYSRIYKIDSRKVIQQMRNSIKHVVLGKIYGMHYKTLATELGITEEAALRFIDDFDKRYPDVKLYMDNQIKYAKAHGFSLSGHGRVRFLFGINSPIYSERMTNERYAINNPIQSDGTDVFFKAITALDNNMKQGPDSYFMRMQTHDSLVTENFIEGLGDRIIKMRKILEESTNLIVKTPVTVKIGYNLGDLHEFKYK